MHSRCMDAADDEHVQPIKVPLVAALPIPLVIEMSACLQCPEHLTWAREEKWSIPKGRDPTGTLCRHIFSVGFGDLCAPKKS